MARSRGRGLVRARAENSTEEMSSNNEPALHNHEAGAERRPPPMARAAWRSPRAASSPRGNGRVHRSRAGEAEEQRGESERGDSPGSAAVGSTPATAREQGAGDGKRDERRHDGGEADLSGQRRTALTGRPRAERRRLARAVSERAGKEWPGWQARSRTERRTDTVRDSIRERADSLSEPRTARRCALSFETKATGGGDVGEVRPSTYRTTCRRRRATTSR